MKKGLRLNIAALINRTGYSSNLRPDEEGIETCRKYSGAVGMKQFESETW